MSNVQETSGSSGSASSEEVLNGSILGMEDENATLEDRLREELAAKDKQIESLNQKLDRLGTTLRYIDQDVMGAAKKWLHAEIPHGRLTFSDFLELLVLEVRQTIKKRYATKISEEEQQTKKIISEELSRRIDERVEKYMEENLPRIRGRLQDYIWVPVLIEPYDKIVYPSGQGKFAQDHGEKVIPNFHAIPLRGSIKHGEGETPEAAWLNLRERFVLALFRKGPEELATMMAMNHNGKLKAFEEAPVFKRDLIEGFRIDVRIKRR